MKHGTICIPTTEYNERIMKAAAMLRREGLAGPALLWLGWLVAAAMLASQFALLVDSGPFKPGGALVLARDYPFAVWVLWLCWALWRADRVVAPARQATLVTA